MKDAHKFMDLLDKEIIHLKQQGRRVTFINCYRNPDETWVGELQVDGGRQQFVDLGHGYHFRNL